MRSLRTVSLLALLAASATASYHFVRYSTRLGYQQPIYEKFDLNALLNRTVPFFIVSDGQEKLAPGDNSNALMSQILLAARTWSDVSTSDLRLTFGGYAPVASGPQGAPGIDIMFSEDVPPGVISYAGPTVKPDTDLNTAEPFTPILRSLVVFRKDLSNVSSVAYPSYSEAFFLNAVHEFGHALGLQHTFTSSAMSTHMTRATTRSKPLASDDISAISILYPSRNFASLFGSVTGRVTQNGNGVNLASVVAISSLNGTSISTLTNPDGTYRIQGVPPGSYQIYVHPVPPPVQGQATPGDIILPRDPDNNPIAVNNRFDLQFFPSTRDPQAARTININAAQSVPDINFAVNRRTTPPTLFAPTTYSFLTNTATNTGNYVRPAFITPQVASPSFIASGYGFVTADSKPVIGLRSSILGGSPAIYNISGFQSQFILFSLFLPAIPIEGDRHLVLENGPETYVLPSAIQLATRRAPEVLNVSWIAPASDGTRMALITATGINNRTRVLIDGEFASIRNFDEAVGTLQIAVPTAATAHVARVVLLNADGQSSLFLRPDAPAQLPFTESEASTFSITPNVINPGTESVYEISAPGARFQSGRVTVGFGSSDIQVRSMVILSPSRLLVSVVATPQAPPAAYTVTVQSGLNHMQLRNGLSLQRLSAAFGRPALQPNPRLFASSGADFVMPGSTAVVLVEGLNSSNPRVTATLNDLPVNVLTAASGRVLLQIPSNASIGWNHLKLNVEGETVNSVLVLISGASPTIQRLEGSDTLAIDAARPAIPGDQILVTFADPSQSTDATLRANEISFTVNDSPIHSLRVERIAPGIFQAAVVLPRTIPDGNTSLSVEVNGRTSSAFPISVRNR